MKDFEAQVLAIKALFDAGRRWRGAAGALDHLGPPFSLAPLGLGRRVSAVRGELGGGELCGGSSESQVMVTGPTRRNRVQSG